MITDVYIVYNDDNQLENLGDTFKVSPFFHFIDDRTSEGRKDAFSLKSQFGAKKTPFIMCYDKDKPVKGFWSEASTNVVKECIKYLNNENLHS